MTLVKWYDRPAMNEWFDPFFVNDHFLAGKGQCGCQPATNIYETEESFVVELAVPGMQKEDFAIQLEKDTLTVSTEKEEMENDGMKYTRREFKTASFKRSFILPKTVDVEKIDAVYEQGILRVHLPKKEEAKVSLSRQISIN